jgi:hypothetical protein
LTKIRKNLTREPYTILLENLGKSKQPMSSYQIKKEMGQLGSTYIYDMIDELAPTKSSIDTNLFSWNAIPGTKKDHHKIIKKLYKIYKLSWLKGDGSYEYYDNICFEKNNDSKIITIAYTSNNFVAIGLSGTQPNSAFIIIHNEGEKIKQVLLAKQNKNNEKLDIYRQNYNPMPIRYLDITLNETAQQLISEIKSKIRISDPQINEVELEASPEILKIKNDRQYWKYGLNIRGFIRYLLGIILLEKQKRRKEKEENKQTQRKKGRKKGDRSFNIRIAEVIDNMSEYHRKEFPFLMYYREFVEILPRNFVIELLREIAEELQYQLESSDMDFLKYWVIRRFYGAITNYFDALEKISLIHLIREIGEEVYNKLKNYHIDGLRYLIDYHEREKQENEQALESYLRNK